MDIKILIIDDNEQFCISLSKILVDNGYQIYSAYNSKDAFIILNQQNINVILLDVRLGEESGIDILIRCSELYRGIPIIMLTGFATIESAVNSIKLGAFDYIQKPIKFEKLIRTIENARTMESLKRENQNLYERIDNLTPRIISNNKRIHELKNTIKKLAATNLPILLFGENGTGKEIFADYIHFESSRKGCKMVKINCASFPDSLLDNELFGHDTGAYTGANTLYKGVFEKADGGVLFLDEIGDMSLNVQAKVLRVLQNNEFFRLGGNDIINVDIQFIAATNKKLEDLIVEGKFREDLYYRLNAATIVIPPLRERKEDIALLSDYFLKEQSRDSEKLFTGISENVLKLFHLYDWPGNIRELRNIIRYAVAICMEDIVGVDDLPDNFTQNLGNTDQKNILYTTEKNVILRELKRCNFNKKKVAESLEISRSTLYSKMKKYEIEF